ncbi:hypothetical protein ACIBSV_03510 [Embleya sp. NPDC050154]|uniref:hypothetical protein n=1 Tax=unclassified Embleya TaxID=2699296 RepID=UPI0037B433DB
MARRLIARANLISACPWYHWHFDRFTVPPDGREMARSPAGPQAYVLGRSLGVQFHPEVTPDTVGAWLDGGGDALARDLGLNVAELRRIEAGGRERADAPADAFPADVAKL